MDREDEDRDIDAEQRRAFRNYMLLMAAGIPVLVLGYLLIAVGYWPVALTLGVLCAVGIRPLRKRLGVD